MKRPDGLPTRDFPTQNRLLHARITASIDSVFAGWSEMRLLALPSGRGSPYAHVAPLRGARRHHRGVHPAPREDASSSDFLRPVFARHGPLVPRAMAVPLRASGASVVALHGGSRDPLAAVRATPVRSDFPSPDRELLASARRRRARGARRAPDPVAVSRERLRPRPRVLSTCSG